MTDEKGIILDIALNAQDNVYHNCLSVIRDSLKKKADIHGLFDIPEKEGIRLNRSYGVRIGAVDFEGEVEEFHSLLPMAFVRFFESDGRELLGFIHLAVFFTNVLFETRLHPLFQTDNHGRLLGYNRRFLDLVRGKEKKAGGLLGRPVNEFLFPTPLEIQKELLVHAAPPEEKDFTPLPAVVPSGPLKWVDRDFMVGFTVEPGDIGLPCLIFGDEPDGTSAGFPDRNGYLFGPGPEGQSIVLKRNGIPIWEEWLGKEVLTPGPYVFLKSGATFTAFKGNRRLFGYTDMEFLDRPEVRLSFYFRQGKSRAMPGLFMGTRAAPPAPRHAYFTTLKKGPDRHFQFSTIDTHADPSKGHSRSFYRLTDMSGVKAQLDGLQRAYEAALKREREASLELQHYREGEGAFIASGKTMSALRERAERVAMASTSVLICGETGTGKEVLARHIHRTSPFAQGPFVKVDCSTLPKTLMESLLFGHEKGAFTGAESAKKGLFESAAGGTLFLDEISNLGLEIQAKLLNFLQDHTITPVGGHAPLKLDLRIIVASNVALEEMVAKGSFRQDLYYRVAVASVTLPPLRERREDIPVLAEYFLDNLNLKYHKSVQGFSPESVRALDRHSWPGNIRELKNVVERAFMYCDGPVIKEELLSLPEPSPSSGGAPGKRGRKPHQALNISREEMVELLRKNEGMVIRVAKTLGVTTRSLYYCFRKHAISPNSLRRNPRKR